MFDWVGNIIDFFKNIFGTVTSWWNTGFNMIVDWVLELLNGLFTGIASILSEWLISRGLVIEIPTDIFNVLDEITYGIGYFLPIRQLIPIVYFMLAFYVAKVIFAVYRLIASTIIKRVNIKI